MIYAVVGILIFWQKSSEPLAYYVSIMLTTFGLVSFMDVVPALQENSTLYFIGQIIQYIGTVTVGWFAYLFPDGRFVPRWTRLNALGWAVYCVAWGLFPSMPLSLIDPFEASFGAFLILMLLGWSVGLVAQAARYRQVDSRQRTQTKWVLLVIAGACAGYASVYLPGVFLPASGRVRLLYDLFGVSLFWLLALPIPVALIAAMLRYRLWVYVLRKFSLGTLPYQHTHRMQPRYG